MANRVLFGEKTTGDFGLWISKPGKNVLTITAETDFLYNSDWKALQVLQTGRLAVTSTASLPKTINIPDLGYRPMVRSHVFGWWGVQMRFVSNSQIVFEVATTGAGLTSWGDEPWGPPDSAKYIRYVIIGSKSAL